MIEKEIEKKNNRQDFISNLRRLANALELKNTIVVLINGKRIRIPENAETSIEYEHSEDGEELEFQLKWKRS